MKKAMIIGGAGFVGAYLADCLREEFGFEVSVTKMPKETFTREGIQTYDLNILYQKDICALFQKVRPDYIFHLAAQSSVALSWENPELTIDVNIKGSMNVMEALRSLDYNPRVLLIGSGEEYGYVRDCEIPITEENAVRPGNLYAATKVCQNLMGAIYARAYHLDIMMVRAFNHIGPNQAAIFVASDFCRQVAEIEKGISEPYLTVGNLSAKRDFTDVRDVVRAYAMLIRTGKPGETYNIGSGNAIAIEELLKMILKQSDSRIKVIIDSKKLRPVDVPIIEADVSKVKKETGWKPNIPLEQTICEMLEYWRSQCGMSRE